MVADLDLDAGLLQRRHDGLPHLGQRVGRRDREVPLLVPRLVPEVRELLAAAVPGALVAVEEVVAGVGLRLIEAHVVEEEELGLRTHVRRVGDAGLAQVRLGLLGDVARVARVGLLGDRIVDRADDATAWASRKTDRSSPSPASGIIDHVGRVDGLPSADRRPVERQAVLEQALLEARRRDRRVLPHAREIDELQVDELDLVLLRELEHFLRCHGPQFLSWPFLRLSDLRWLPCHVRPCGCARPLRPAPRRFCRRRCGPSSRSSRWRRGRRAPARRGRRPRASPSARSRRRTPTLGRPPSCPRAPEALDLGHGHALDADLGEGVLHLVELERLDDGFNLLHGSGFAARWKPAAPSHASLAARGNISVVSHVCFR